MVASSKGGRFRSAGCKTLLPRHVCVMNSRSRRSVTGCNMYNARAQSYVNAVLNQYQSLATRAGWPIPY